MDSGENDWADSTIIQESELKEYFYNSVETNKSNLHIHGKTVKILPGGFNYSGLEEFLGDRFADYVFSSDKKNQLINNDKSPAVRAQRKASINQDYQRDGNLGEFLLFLFVDGFLDVPMVSHKIIHKQNYNHEVYGSDNIFFGEIFGDTCIGVGEAKIYDNVIDGVRSAVDSIEDFHDEDSRRYMDQELSLAPKNLSENLTKQQIDLLAEVMTTGNYADYPTFHPVFVCYGNDELSEVEDIMKSVGEIESEIDDILLGENYLSRVQDQVDNGHGRLDRVYLLFIILPVPDLDEFRKRMLSAIVPGMKPVLERDNEQQDKSEAQS